VVGTDQGPVRGVSEDTVWAYRGIPYAAPPIGNLRFAAPTEYGCFDAVFEAASFGDKCPQMEVDDAGNVTGVSGDEDCLTLNVWSPEGADGAPVLFFIHGGGNVQGSSLEQSVDGMYVYDGAVLAAQEGAVVVTINYRLGHLGWLVHDDLAAEGGGVSGNYGLRDQVFALEWVKRNIAAFGGNADRLLIFGESAGAVNVCNLVVTPLAAGLFSAAIMESGSCHAITAENLATLTDDILVETGCAAQAEPIACLRAVDATELLMAEPAIADLLGVGQVSPGPSVDGSVLPQHPRAILASGAHNHVPLIVGVNSEETGRAVGAVPTEQAFDTSLLGFAGGNQALANLAKAQYPVAEYQGSYRKALVALTSDAKFVCTARASVRAADAGQDEPVYRYYFTHALDNSPQLAALGAWHGLELPFVFGHVNVGGYTPSQAELALSLAIGGYWARFADGDPNGMGAVSWPLMNGDTDAYLGLDDPIAPGRGIRGPQCDFWDTIYPD
jgi:para-nitrobenzyl esterase